MAALDAERYLSVAWLRNSTAGTEAGKTIGTAVPVEWQMGNLQPGVFFKGNSGFVVLTKRGC